MEIVSAGAPKTVSATIANGASLSGAILIAGQLAVIQTPAAWTAADMTFQGSVDNGSTFSDIYDGATERIIASAQIPTASSKSLAQTLSQWVGYTHIKIRSGTGAIPVNQGAQRVIPCGLAG